MTSVFEILSSDHADLPDDHSKLELKQARRALAVVKNVIGPEQMLDLLSDRLDEGNAFWRKVLQSSDGELVPAIAEFRVKGLSAMEFSQWFKNALSISDKLIAANPEHYRIYWAVSPSENPDGFGTMSVTEALGGVLTKFNIHFGGPELAYLPLDPDFPQKVLGSLRLEDGSEIGRLMHQFRDCEGGMIAKFCILLPKGVPERVVTEHSEHLIVEWANWFESAVAELKS